MNLQSVQGVSKAKAEKLEANGIYTAEDLAGSNVAKVDAIDGLGPDVVVNAIHLIEYEHGKMDHNGITYRCSYCEQSGFKVHPSLKVHEERCEENPDSDGGDGGRLFSGVVN